MNKQEQAFRRVVWRFYQKHKRDHLPWRQTSDPYLILVSELMLQQTQVERVIPKYIAFVKKWPTVERLAKAPLKDVLVLWQGLGYNRRAKYLHETVKEVVEKHGGVFPRAEEQLLALPGVGPYTAKAIMAFAYNQPVVLIETNVRQVFIHHFFSQKSQLADKEILELVERTLPDKRAREWYAALMDYGSYLKRTHGNNTKRSLHYKKQTPFKGSDREIRGAILRSLSDGSSTVRQISNLNENEVGRVKIQIKKLVDEGLVVKTGRSYSLPK